MPYFLNNPSFAEALKWQIGNSVVIMRPGQIFEYGNKLYTSGIHHHNCYELIIVESGRGHFKLDDKDYILSKGDLIVSDPGIPHCIYVEKGNRMNSFYFYVEIIASSENLAMSPEERSVFNFLKSHEYLVAGRHHLLAYLNFFNEYAGATQGTYGIEAALHNLVIESIRELSLSNHGAGAANQMDKTTAILEKALSFIANNQFRKITAEELARHMNMSVRNLQYIFRRELNTSVKSYITAFRMGQAAVHLKTNYSVTAVSRLFNYPNVAQFSAQYKKHFGISPKETKNQFLKDSMAINVEYDKNIL